MSSLALIGGTIIDGRGGEPLQDGVVVIRDGKIAQVGPRSQVVIGNDITEQLDVSGKTVMPGLADMHVHFAGGWDGEATDFMGFERYLNATLYAGVTTLFDVGNALPYIVQLRQEIRAGRVAGPRFLIVGPLLDGPDASWGPISQVIVSIDQVPRIVEQLKAAGIDMLKVYSQLSALHVAAIAREGKKQGLPVVLDAWRLNGCYDLMKLVPIRAWAHLDAAEKMTDGEVQYMADHDMFQLTTLTVIESFARRRLRDLSFLKDPLIADVYPEQDLAELRSFAEKTTQEPPDMSRVETAMANALALHQAGVPLVAGTDSPYPGVFYGEAIHHELELLVETGLTPLEAIRCATANAAKFAGAEGEWGVLAPGSAGEVLVVAGDPAHNISDTKKIDMVIQNGKVLDREGLRFDPSQPLFRPVSEGMEQTENPLRGSEDEPVL